MFVATPGRDLSTHGRLAFKRLLAGKRISTLAKLTIYSAHSYSRFLLLHSDPPLGTPHRAGMPSRTISHIFAQAKAKGTKKSTDKLGNTKLAQLSGKQQRQPAAGKTCALWSVAHLRASSLKHSGNFKRLGKSIVCLNPSKG